MNRAFVRPGPPATGSVQGVSLDAQSAIPIYRQLADQIRLLIELGELAPGSRLPSAIQLADHLDVHRNTIQKAYRSLQKSGAIVSDGRRGSFVVHGDEHRPQASEHVMQLIAQLVGEAAAAGIPVTELSGLVHLQATRYRTLNERTVVFVECNPSSLEHYQREIERAVGVRVVPVLLDAVASEITGVNERRLVVTTFFHYADVRRRLQAAGSPNELVAINVRPHLEVLEQLNSLRPGTRLGVVYLADDPDATARLRRMYDAISHVRLSHVSVVPVALSPMATEDDFRGLDAVLVRPENISRVRPHIPRDVRVIEFRNTLDEASIELLRDTITVRHDGG